MSQLEINPIQMNDPANGRPDAAMQEAMIKRRVKRQRRDRFFVYFCISSALVCVAILFVLLVSIGLEGTKFLSWDFLGNQPSRFPAKTGMYTAILGSVWIVIVCGLFSVPIGISTAILLEEYKAKSKFGQRIQSFVGINISNLAGVPSIVYGLLGLTLFVYGLGLFGNMDSNDFAIGSPESIFFIKLPFGKSVLTSGLTLGLVILPVIITASQEALRGVPDSIRQGALALGATRWQMVWRTTLPMSIPGMMTGTILALSRAIGESAPILIVGASMYASHPPENLMDSHAAMPLQIYNWAGRPQLDFHSVAATGIIVLLSILLSINAVAIFIRYKFEKAVK